MNRDRQSGSGVAQHYLVGGAVRDRLLGRPVKDRDWVVVGATPEAMIQAGYLQVGGDFPVFLHPQTKEEYALARTERKSAPGYRGFVVHAAPDVTLEDDLRRRDLTINAIAQTEAGALVDPYSGVADLEKRLLRHVSPAFREDPVRVLRTARFAARYRSLGFRVAEETMALMREMVDSGELDALVPERVWQEMESAFSEPSPSTFIEVLRACGALKPLLPEVDALFGVPQTPEYHPEIDTGVHTMMVMDQAARLSGGNSSVVFAGLVHDLGKALTPEEHWPTHHRHESIGIEPVEAVCSRLKVPNKVRGLARNVCEFHLHMHRVLELRAGKVLRLIERVNGLRSSSDFDAFVIACEADARGRKGLENREYPQAEYLRRARDAALAVSVQSLLDRGLTGASLGDALQADRIRSIKHLEKGSLSEA